MQLTHGPKFSENQNFLDSTTNFTSKVSLVLVVNFPVSV